MRLLQLSKAGIYFLKPLKGGVISWVQSKRVDLLSVLQAHAQEEDQEYEIRLGASNRSNVGSSHDMRPKFK